MPAQLALQIQKGSTWVRAVTIVDKDLTGFEAKLQIRPNLDSENVLAEISQVSGITIAGAVLTLTFTKEETAAWNWRKGVYDLVVTDTLGRAETILTGPVEAVRNVTR